jgi:hypothetical protein
MLPDYAAKLYRVMAKEALKPTGKVDGGISQKHVWKLTRSVQIADKVSSPIGEVTQSDNEGTYRPLD